jgi:trimeric autotransporter adhesin
MKTKLFFSVPLLFVLLAVGTTWVMAQGLVTAPVLVCVQKTTGIMQVVATAADCGNKGTLLTLYSQEGVDGRLAAIESRLAAVETENASLRSQVQAQETRLANLESLLVHFSRSGNEITISGANLNIVNGMGSTETTNTLGNLVIGYNESRGPEEADIRTGSHMLVIGKWNDFSSFGGIVTGSYNETSARYASIIGGFRSIVSGNWSTVTGGAENIASRDFAAVSGGLQNEASGFASWVGGGAQNSAIGDYATVSGGELNVAGERASVSGGYSNTASGIYSSISGGQEHTATGLYDWIAGLLFQDE